MWIENQYLHKELPITLFLLESPGMCVRVCNDNVLMMQAIVISRHAKDCIYNYLFLVSLLVSLLLLVLYIYRCRTPWQIDQPRVEGTTC